MPRSGSDATESAISETHAMRAVTSSAVDSVIDSPDQLVVGIHTEVRTGSGFSARFAKRLIG